MYNIIIILLISVHTGRGPRSIRYWTITLLWNNHAILSGISHSTSSGTLLFGGNIKFYSLIVCQFICSIKASILDWSKKYTVLGDYTTQPSGAGTLFSLSVDSSYKYAFVKFSYRFAFISSNLFLGWQNSCLQLLETSTRLKSSKKKNYRALF